MAEYGQLVPWLGPLLRTEFFGHCRNHNSTGKLQRNHFCLDCHAAALCPQGLAENHKNHLSLQIRKASHRDAVRVLDIQKLLDVSSIQAYTINSSKILFLHSRPPQKLQSFKAGGLRFNCETCHRSIADPVSFCSINCKRLAMLQGDLHLATKSSYQTPSTQLENLATSCRSSYELYGPSLGNGASLQQLNYKSLMHQTSSKNSSKQQELCGNTTLVVQQVPNYSSNNSPTTTLLQLEIPNESTMMVESKIKKRKLSLCCNEGGSCFVLSPMSVLMVPTRSSIENSWTEYISPMTSCFSGPSTPLSIEEASSTRTHSRKQCHPHRAPMS
ncbi:unnamed protein product [Sphagnum troendelagicum]|uniref:PLATZ transcription factor family protein n=1 Tax=Sphagnum troendelagicum TaxID=128251 RepID=A0ABP0TL56_9BRYO